MAAPNINPSSLLSLCRTASLAPCRQHLEQLDLARLLPALLQQDGDAQAKAEAEQTLAELRALVAAGSAALAAAEEGAALVQEAASARGRSWHCRPSPSPSPSSPRRGSGC